MKGSNHVTGLPLVAAVAAWLGLVAVPTPRAQEPALRLLARDGVRALAVTLVEGQEMVALADVATVFRLTVHEDPRTAALTVSYRDKAIVLTEGQTLASVAGNLVSLPAPATRAERGWLVPVEFLSRAVSRVYESRVELRKASRLVIVGDLRVPRVVVKPSTVGGEARIAFEVTPATPHTVSEEPGRLVVRFEAHALDASLPADGTGDLVIGFRIGEPATSIAIDLTSRYGSFRSSDFAARGAASQFVLEILPAGADTLTSTAPTPAAEPTGAGALPFLSRTQPYTVRTIVIDPGHGGDDHGAQGPSEVSEKTITLSVARRLKRAFESQLGVRVLLTRNGDQTVRLDERASLANNSKADLLLSLHVNFSVRPSVTGAAVFYASLEQYGSEARAMEAVESQILPVFGGGARPIDITLWEMAQARHLDRSATLGRVIEDRLRSQVEMSPRPIQQAPFRVLVGANMPAALIEMGFISNPQEEQRLTSGAYQNTIVQALVRSVVQFRREAEQADRIASRQPGATPSDRPRMAPQG